MSAIKTIQSPVFLIYGATGGIGSALCKKLLDLPNNAHVILAGRNSEKLSSLQQSLDSDRTSIQLIDDVTNHELVDKTTANALATHKKLNGVANCVGSIVLKSAHTTTPKEFEDTLRINLMSSFNILRSSVKAMMKQPEGGSLVFCSSAVAMHGIPNHEAIAAAKGGLSAMARSAASTYAPKNIRINCVAPGLTRTPLASRITSSETALKASEAMHALKRIGEPEDVASAIAFLLDPGNAYITGQVLAVDGGLSSLKPQ